MSENTSTASEAATALSEISAEVGIEQPEGDKPTGNKSIDAAVARFRRDETPASKHAPALVEQVERISRDTGYGVATDPRDLVRIQALASQEVFGEDALMERDLIALQSNPAVDVYDRDSILLAADALGLKPDATGTIDFMPAYRQWRAESLRAVRAAAGKDGGRIYDEPEWIRAHAVQRPKRSASDLMADPEAANILPRNAAKATQHDLGLARSIARMTDAERGR